QGVIEIARSQHRQYGTEDFLLSQARGRRDFIEDVRRDVIAFALERADLAGIDEPALALALVDGGENALVGVRVDDGSDRAAGIFGGRYFKAARRSEEHTSELQSLA